MLLDPRSIVTEVAFLIKKQSETRDDKLLGKRTEIRSYRRLDKAVRSNNGSRKLDVSVEKDEEAEQRQS